MAGAAQSAQSRMTLAEFLELQERSEARFEYDYGHLIPVDSGTVEHHQIITNLGTAAVSALRPAGCTVLLSGMMVAVDPMGNFVQPDIVVICGNVEVAAKRRAVTNPKILIEVLSPSTKDYDRGSKFQFYRQIHTLAEYLAVHQDRPLIEHHFRRPDGLWLTRDVAGLDSVLRLESIEFEIPLRAIYDSIVFPPESSRSDLSLELHARDLDA
jgi:Uma2 family endonuclease